MNYDRMENGNLVFHNGDEDFTFVDMGNYVGHNSRQWYEQSPNCWRLMFYDDNKADQPIHIEALVDSTGSYSKILLQSDNIRRVLLLNGNLVDEDIIYEMGKDNSFIPKKTYISFEDKYMEKNHPDLQSYLSMNHKFLSNTSEVYNQNNFDNYIKKFFSYNHELSKLIDNQESVKSK